MKVEYARVSSTGQNLQSQLDVWKRLFKNLCQSGKITNTQGNIDEDRNRCRAIRS